MSSEINLDDIKQWVDRDTASGGKHRSVVLSEKRFKAVGRLCDQLMEIEERGRMDLQTSLSICDTCDVLMAAANDAGGNSVPGYRGAQLAALISVAVRRAAGDAQRLPRLNATIDGLVTCFGESECLTVRYVATEVLLRLSLSLSTTSPMSGTIGDMRLVCALATNLDVSAARRRFAKRGFFDGKDTQEAVLDTVANWRRSLVDLGDCVLRSWRARGSTLEDPTIRGIREKLRAVPSETRYKARDFEVCRAVYFAMPTDQAPNDATMMSGVSFVSGTPDKAAAKQGFSKSPSVDKPTVHYLYDTTSAVASSLAGSLDPATGGLQPASASVMHHVRLVLQHDDTRTLLRMAAYLSRVPGTQGGGDMEPMIAQRFLAHLLSFSQCELISGIGSMRRMMLRAMATAQSSDQIHNAVSFCQHFRGIDDGFQTIFSMHSRCDVLKSACCSLWLESLVVRGCCNDVLDNADDRAFDAELREAFEQATQILSGSMKMQIVLISVTRMLMAVQRHQPKALNVAVRPLLAASVVHCITSCPGAAVAEILLPFTKYEDVSRVDQRDESLLAATITSTLESFPSASDRRIGELCHFSATHLSHCVSVADVIHRYVRVALVLSAREGDKLLSAFSDAALTTFQ